MMLYARSCERPSKSSASVLFPSSVSNWYSFSTGTQGSWRRCWVTLWSSSACSASSFASSSRAACHSSRVPILCAGIFRLLGPFVTSAWRLMNPKWPPVEPVRYDRRAGPNSSPEVFETPRSREPSTGAKTSREGGGALSHLQPAWKPASPPERRFALGAGDGGVGPGRNKRLTQRPAVSWLEQPSCLPVPDEILVDGEPRCYDRDAERQGQDERAGGPRFAAPEHGNV